MKPQGEIDKSLPFCYTPQQRSGKLRRFLCTPLPGKRQRWRSPAEPKHSVWNMRCKDLHLVQPFGLLCI
jgi:hypothetical protein